MRALVTALLTLSMLPAAAAPGTDASYVEPPYEEPKVMFDFYFDRPDKMGAALYWLRALMNPLMEAPYNMAPEFLNTVIVIHGTEIVALAKRNYARYKDEVERLRYYAQLGVKIHVCALAADDFGYTPDDLQDFVEMVPSAISDLVYWQQQGYGLIRPQVLDKRFSNEEIR